MLAVDLSSCPHQVIQHNPHFILFLSTGNLSFLNWLTMAPSIWYLDDRFLKPIFAKATTEQIQRLQDEDKVGLCIKILTINIFKELAKDGQFRMGRIRGILSLAVGLLLAWLSVPIVVNLASPNQSMNRCTRLNTPTTIYSDPLTLFGW